MCLEAWKKAKNNKKAMDKLVADTRSDVKNKKKDEDYLGEVEEKFNEACMDEAKKHKAYITACIDDKRSLLGKEPDECEKNKLTEEIKDLEIQLNQVLEDKKRKRVKQKR